MRPVLGTLGVLLAVQPSVAGPLVSVRGRTEILLAPVLRAEGGVSIRGTVRERASNEPIAAGSVHIEVDGVAFDATLDADGHFDQFVAAEPGRRLRVAIDFGGEDRLDPSRVAIPDLDVAKRPLTLTLIAPPRHSRADGRLELQVQAQESFQPVAIRTALHYGSVDADPDQLPKIADLTTDDTGIATFALDPAQLGDPGQKRLEVRFPGNDVFDPAQAQSNLAVTSTTALTFTLESTTVKFEGRIHGRGRLVDDRGKPLAGQPVALSIDGAPPRPAPGTPAPAPAAAGAEVASVRRVVDEVITAHDGTFTLEGRASELVPGAYRVQAVFESPAIYLEPTRSTPVLVVVAEKRPVPVGYSFAAFGATLASILAFVALRTRPWTRWLSRLRPEAARAAPEATAGPGAAPPRTGLALARPGLAATLRRPQDFSFTGVVSSAVDARAIAGARVELPGHVIETDEAGRFAIEELSPGEHPASVACPGYVTERFAVTIPHRGELRDARVDLLPVREHIFQLYRGAAEPLLPKPELWGVWTPRQIVDHVRLARPAQALGALTDYVEEKYFSARTPMEDEIPLAVERVHAAEREARPGA
jgi:hypothetical protein